MHVIRSDEVAKALSITPRALRRLVAEGRFPQPIRITKKLLVWRTTAIDMFLRDLEKGISK